MNWRARTGCAPPRRTRSTRALRRPALPARMLPPQRALQWREPCAVSMRDDVALAIVIAAQAAIQYRRELAFTASYVTAYWIPAIAAMTACRWQR